jgi:cardiolipin synthase (CMP-forming)
MVTIANCITLSRILLTPIVIALMVHNLWLASSIVFLCAAATDLIDGYVARIFGQSSKFGQILDPIADKILLGSVMFAMLWLSTLNFYGMFAMFWFLLCKEIILLFGGAVLWFRYKKFIAPSVLSRAVSLCEVGLVLLFFVMQAELLCVPAISVYFLMITNVVVSCCLLIRYFKIINHEGRAWHKLQ